MEEKYALKDLARLRIRLKALAVTQELIGEATELSQSQISRVLSGRGTRASKGFQRLCVYAFSQAPVAASPRARTPDETLLSAVETVWDGTPDHAKALASVILSLSALKSTHRAST